MTVRRTSGAEVISDLTKDVERLKKLVTAPSVMGIPSDGQFDTIKIGTGTDQVLLDTVKPDAPTNLQVTTGAFMDVIFADVSWTAPANTSVSRYDLEVAKKDGLTYQLQRVISTGGTGARVEPLEPNTAYGFRVTGFNRVGVMGTQSAWVDVTTGKDATPPAQVTGVSIAAGIRSVTIDWTENTELDVVWGSGLYEVQLDTVNTFNSVNLRVERVSATVTSFTNLTTGTTYYARIAAIDSSGNIGPWSATVSATTGTLVSADLADQIISEVKLADGAVSSAKIVDAAIITAKIADLAVANAKIGNLAVTNAKIADLAVDSAKIASLAVTNAKIASLAVDNAKINDMSVAKLTAGTLAASTITLSGQIAIGNPTTNGIYINSNGIRAYSGGALTIAIDSTGSATFYGTLSGATGTFSGTLTAGSTTIDSGGLRIVSSSTWSNSRGIRWYNGGSVDYVRIWNAANYGLRLEAQGSGGYLDTFFSNYRFHNHDGTIAYLSITSFDGRVNIRNPTVSGDSRIYGGFGGTSAAGLNDRGGDNVITFEWDGTMRIFADSTNVKNFIIDHPQHTDRYLIHTTVEGPENAVFYRGKGQLQKGQAWVKLPDYFEALTQKENRTVQLTPILRDTDMPKPKKPVPAESVGVPYLAATEVVDGYFIVMQAGGFVCDDCEFFWEVKAVRKDVPSLMIEPLKTEVVVLGDGPYRYYKVKEPVL